jgi:hypothetical protein
VKRPRPGVAEALAGVVAQLPEAGAAAVAVTRKPNKNSIEWGFNIIQKAVADASSESKEILLSIRPEVGDHSRFLLPETSADSLKYNCPCGKKNLKITTAQDFKEHFQRRSHLEGVCGSLLPGLLCGF